MRKIKTFIKKANVSFGFFGVIGLAGLIFVAVIAILVLAPSSFAGTPKKQTPPQDETMEMIKKPSKEVPYNWNWKKRDIKFDHMYRDKE